MILKSMEVASAAPEGAKVVMSSACQRREQFRLKGLWICQKGHCCLKAIAVLRKCLPSFTVNSFMMK